MLQNRGAMYYYITNLQGDVIRLVNSSGQTAAYYEYDPYGNAIKAAGSHCEINPLRYRGYVYDTETGLYYCQSRYYDPEIGRFISADTYTSTGQGIIGNNMFAYCGNNPINFADYQGAYAWKILGKAVVGAAIGGVVDAVCTFSTTGSLVETGKAFVEGAVDGFAASILSDFAWFFILKNAVGTFMSCVSNGVDIQASLFAAGVAAAAGLAFNSVDSKAIDFTIGLGMSLISTSVTEGIIRYSESDKNIIATIEPPKEATTSETIGPTAVVKKNSRKGYGYGKALSSRFRP